MSLPRLILASFLFIAALLVEDVAAVIPVGGLCVGFAGPVNDVCIQGSECCNISPDRSLCTVTSNRGCAERYLEEGDVCVGIGGPSRYPCIAGTKCCNLSPDNSQCLSKCPGAKG